MNVEFCPRCRVPAAVVMSETRERRFADDGTPYDVAVRTVHCTACHAFIRREEIPLPHPSKDKISA